MNKQCKFKKVLAFKQLAVGIQNYIHVCQLQLSTFFVFIHDILKTFVNVIDFRITFLSAVAVVEVPVFATSSL